MASEDMLRQYRHDGMDLLWSRLEWICCGSDKICWNRFAMEQIRMDLLWSRLYMIEHIFNYRITPDGPGLHIIYKMTHHFRHFMTAIENIEMEQ